MRNALLVLAIGCLLFSCKKSTKKPSCEGIICDYSHFFYFRLVDKAGKNMVFGTDATIQRKNVSLWHHSREVYMSANDSLNNKGCFMLDMANSLFVADAPLEYVIKVVKGNNNADTTAFTVRPVSDQVSCCGQVVTGVYLNNMSSFIKGNQSDFIVNIPIE